MKNSLFLLSSILKVTCLLIFLPIGLCGQPNQAEAEYYRILTIPVPEGIHLEVGGLSVLQDGSLGVATRRGDVWIVENPSMANGNSPHFRRFATGLHEPLGLLYHDGALYAAQRGELTRMIDSDGDRIADLYETVYRWPLSAHYHEYSYGPVLAPDGSLFVTTNVAFGDQEWWRGESRIPWRGWVLRISQDGTMEPWAAGVRSPAGYGLVDGAFFYTDNQGDFVGSGGLWHVPKGGFMGHPAGLKWSTEPNSPVTLTEAEFYARVDKRQLLKDGVYVQPQNIESEAKPDLLAEVRQDFPELQLPAVILPHGKLGISNSELKVDQTNGAFGPFEGQVFVGDQGQSKIMRIDLEKINGQYQGVAFDFLTGFQAGVLRMAWSKDGQLFVGETNRGWGSAGNANEGLQLVSWSGKIPFEIKTVKAKPDGFEIEFTFPVDRTRALDLDSYDGISYTYKYHAAYGSPPIQEESIQIKGVQLSQDGKKVRVVIDNLRKHFVHELSLHGIRQAQTDRALLHPHFYYTLHQIPEGTGLDPVELSTFRSSDLEAEKASSAGRSIGQKTTASKVVKLGMAPPSYAEIEPLLIKNTCIACHQENNKVVGPSFEAIAKRNYSNKRIVELIYRPEPKNWPEYATPMAAMPQVPENEALKIAAWINSLD